MKNRWELSRIGIFNYWYYGYQEFHFKDGRLLLRGQNGSGKSVTMQSVITFLLDGNKHPSRLDPFGSKDRKMRDYLLGEKHVSKIEERIGYLFLEYHKPGTNQYMTTGFGLEAKKDATSLHSEWGFVIYNPFKRIGDGENDLKLYKEEKINGKLEQIPLIQSDFKKELGLDGEVASGQEEYQELINKHVFGFPDIEGLKKFTWLLVQLKSPKLSKSFNPSTVCEILTNSLPELSEEELTPLTDTIESLDYIEKEILETERDLKSISKLNKAYDNYNSVVLLEKSHYYLEAKKELDKIQKLKKEKEKELSDVETSLSNTTTSIKQIKIELEALKSEEKSLKNEDVFTLKEEEVTVRDNIKTYQNEYSEKNNRLENKKKEERDIKSKINDLDYEHSNLQKEMKTVIEELDYFGGETKLQHHENLSAHFLRQIEDSDYDFTLWENQMNSYHDILKKIKVKLDAHQKLIQDRDNINNQILQLEKTIEKENKEQNRLGDIVDEKRAELQDDIDEWFSLIELLDFSESEKQNIIRLIMGLYETVSADEIKEIVDTKYSQVKEQISSDLFNLNNESNDAKIKLEELKEQKEKLINQPDIEPEWHKDKEEALLYLDESKIPFLPFYAAVEFKENVSQEKRGLLESVIFESGLLQSLIVPENYSEMVSQHIPVITQLYKREDNILQYFEIIEGNGVQKNDVASILEGISILENSESFILESGQYKSGFIHGQSANYGEAKYIGQLARKKNKEKYLEKLDNAIIEISNQIEMLEKKVIQAKNKQSSVKEEYTNFPIFSILRSAVEAIENKIKEIENIYLKNLQQLNDNSKKFIEKIKVSYSEIKEEAVDIELNIELNIFTKAVDFMTEYKVNFANLKNHYDKSISTKERLNEQQALSDRTLEDIEILTDEVIAAEQKKDKFVKRLEDIEKQLKMKNADEILSRIEYVVQRLEELPNTLFKYGQEEQKLKSNQENILNSIKNQVDTLATCEKILLIWQQLFKEELGYGYYSDLIKDDDEQDTIILAKDIYTKLKEEFGTDNKFSSIENIKQNAKNRLDRNFNEELAILIQYNMLKKEIMSSIQEPSNQREEEKIRLIKSVSSRYLIELEYEQHKRNPYEVAEKLENHLQIQKDLLTEKDKELFEQIMIDSIGDIIKNKVQDAEFWINEMNSFMKRTDNTNGLLFQIKWIPNGKDDKEDHLEPRKLMEYLKRDYSLLSQPEKDAISKHFRKKVQYAKNRKEIDEHKEEPLLTIIKYILDYRRWFSFEIQCKLGQENLKPLTNTRFNQFSGGEKALAMYTPLLSAVHSRLKEAKADAPRIISLDEAFAGVDDKNIEQMFSLVQNLDFDYIMNSQALWGCYPKVDSLSIYELLRPLDAPYVGVARYEWDGRNKVYIHEDIHVEQDGSDNTESKKGIEQLSLLGE
ncbi:TIGR02680 family protein [Metabacillus lacus]|uniref:TIGR02680 family protein n=1 Tax=Metabacillus lacus TaxID=1983721 RepID=UPI0014781709